MRQRRLLILAASAAVLFLIWSFFHQSEDDVLQTQEIYGRVVEIHQRSSASKATPGGNKNGSIVIAVVAIDGPTVGSDGHARILLQQGQYQVGDEVPLRLKLYKDGSRKVVLTPKRNEDTQAER